MSGNALRVAAAALFALFALALFAALAFGLANRSSPTGRSGMTRVGKPAPDFAMPLLNGGEFRLSARGDVPAVINFWASWCPPCRDESPAFERTWRAYRDDGVIFVGVNIQDAEEDAAEYAREFGLTFVNGRDIDGRITIDYGVTGLPVTFFVGRGGAVEGVHVGAVPEDKLEAWTRALIAGVKPPGE